MGLWIPKTAARDAKGKWFDLHSGHHIRTIRRHTKGRIYKYATITISSLRLVQALAKQGIVPRKTGIVIPPTIRSDLEKHLWRGIIDGDGCIHVNKRSSCPFLTLSGSKATCTAFTTWASHITGYPIRVLSYLPRAHQNRSSYIVSIGGRKAQKVLHELYDDAQIFLTRKMNKAQSIFATEVVK